MCPGHRAKDGQSAEAATPTGSESAGGSSEALAQDREQSVTRERTTALSRLWSRLLGRGRAADEGPSRGDRRAADSVPRSLAQLEQVKQLSQRNGMWVRHAVCRRSRRHFVVKAAIARHPEGECLRVERRVLSAASQSPFIVGLVTEFRDGPWDCLVLEAALGGDLYTVYSQQQLFGSEEHARFYGGCAVLGLQHLHARRILYRDVKMENLVLDAAGYCKMCDFGTASFDFDGASGLCGTPEYMAPEVLDGGSHTRAADWWSLGVLICELMMGHPFYDPELEQIVAKVSAGMAAVKGFPREEHNWSSLVLMLCRTIPEERLPLQSGGDQGVVCHAWFNESPFDWVALEKGSMEAPALPRLAGSE